MGDLDNNQLRLRILCDVADNTVAPLDAENIANYVNDNTVHNMNNQEWTDEQMRMIVEIDEEERKRGRNSMR